jgi:hypothetical protein
MAARVIRYDKSSTLNIKVAAAQTIAEGDLIGVDSSGNAVQAAKTQGAIIPAIGVALRDAVANDWLGVAPIAEVGGYTSLTPGAQQYLSTAGARTSTRSTTAADLLQAVGTAISATKILFNVTPSFLVYQAAGNTTLGGS